MINTVLTYMDASTCVASVIIILLALYFWPRLTKNLPPTPAVALPVIGHLYMLKKNPRQQLLQWSDKYKHVFMLQTGLRTTVFINTLEAMKETLIKKADHFSDRPGINILAKHFPHFTKGIAMSSGANWKAQRTTSLAILRNFGMGKNILAEKITEEVSMFSKELAKKNGKPSDIRYLTNMSVSNVICSIIFGKRFEFDDPKFLKQIEMFNESLNTNTAILIINFFPILYYLPFDFFKGKRLLSLATRVFEYTCNMITEIKKSYTPDNLNNYIVAYIHEMKKEQQSGQKSYLDEINMSRNIDNLFLAGTDTTSTTIVWSLLYVLNYPEVQKKIYAEIVEHVGTERSPNFSDKRSLKYLTAFIMEVQRKASIVPISLSYLCTNDTTIAGYTIPKGAIILPLLDAVHKSKEIWGDPENFRPERFLDEQGNILKKEELVPFSLGRRVCLGESLAKMELFLYLSTLFQTFEFLPESPDKVPPLTETWGGVASSEPFVIRSVERRK